jgi:hypothetical protein
VALMHPAPPVPLVTALSMFACTVWRGVHSSVVQTWQHVVAGIWGLQDQAHCSIAYRALLWAKLVKWVPWGYWVISMQLEGHRALSAVR